jgi:hypothetical protein
MNINIWATTSRIILSKYLQRCDNVWSARAGFRMSNITTSAFSLSAFPEAINRSHGLNHRNQL